MTAARESGAAVTDPEPAEFALRTLRYLLRTPLLALHLAVLMPCCVLLLLSPAGRLRLRGISLTEWTIRAWSGTLLRIFGMRVRRIGGLSGAPAMLLANHLTWVDIEVLHSLRGVAFVAKHEISRWPLVGRLATLAGTVYHRRGCTRSQAQVCEDLADRLRRGQSVAIFPEGRTGAGDEVLPFHGRLLKAAVDAEAPVQPVAIGYFRRGVLCNSEVAFGPRESFLANMLRLLGAPALDVDVLCLPPMPTHGHGRRELAALAREQIVAALETRDAG